MGGEAADNGATWSCEPVESQNNPHAHREAHTTNSQQQQRERTYIMLWEI